jgi:hypothetical protein
LFSTVATANILGLKGSQEMSKKIKVEVSEIMYLAGRMATINKLDLDDIEFTVEGKPVEIDPKTLEDFKFTGLNNTDFILSNAYLKKGGLL